MEEKPEYLERTRQKLELARDIHDKFEMKICHQNFIIHPNVFNPNIFFGTDFLGQELITIIREFDQKSPNFLDIGTGAGYMSVLAVLNGASHVTCTDINHDALENAQANVLKYNMIDRITVQHSDVFSTLNTSEKFDIIFWNYPFGHIDKPVEQLELLERALMDPFYRSLDTYLRHAKDYLNPNGGRLFLGFSNTAGYPQTFENIAKKYQWRTFVRNEIHSNTTPVMHVGMYELLKIQ